MICLLIKENNSWFTEAPVYISLYHERFRPSWTYLWYEDKEGYKAAANVSQEKYIEKLLESFNMNDVANQLSVPLQPYVNLSKKRNAKRGCGNKFNEHYTISFNLWFFDVWTGCYKTRHCKCTGSLLEGSWLILARHIGRSSSQLWDIWRGPKSKLPRYGKGYWNYMDFVTLIWQVIRIHAKRLVNMFLYLPMCNSRESLNYLWLRLNI